MSNLQTLVRAVGSEPIRKAVDACFLRGLLDADEHHPSLMELVRYLVTVDFELLEAIALSELRTSHPNYVSGLLRAAHAATPPRQVQFAIQRLARQIGYDTNLAEPDQKEPVLTHSQREVLRQLDELWDLFQAQASSPGVVRLRISPLLVAPTGSGKTFLVNLFAKRHGLAVFRSSVAEWMVQGSKTTAPTLELLRKRLLANLGGFVLHVDELDKFTSQEAWGQAQRGELFSLLDGLTAADGWSDADRATLRERVMIIGSGTWQTIFEGKLGRLLGFAPKDNRTTTAELEIRSAKTIGTELMNRWGQILFLRPLTAHDYRELMPRLRIQAEFLDPEEAAASGQNFRALETALTRQAIASRRAFAPSPTLQETPSS